MRAPTYFFLFSLCLVSCTAHKDESKTHSIGEEKKTQQNDLKSLSNITQEAKMSQSQHYFLATENGIIEKINAKSTLKKGQIAFRLNNTERFTLHSKHKKVFQQQIISQLQFIPKENVELMQKWQTFAEAFRADTLLPIFPAFQYREEVQWFGDKQLINSFNQLVKEEKSISAFFVKFPASGNNIEWTVKAGDRIQKGDTLARYLSK